MKNFIGNFNGCENRTYAECARVYLWEKLDDDVKNAPYTAEVIDSVLYLYENGSLYRVNNNFDLEIR